LEVVPLRESRVVRFENGESVERSGREDESNVQLLEQHVVRVGQLVAEHEFLSIGVLLQQLLHFLQLDGIDGGEELVLRLLSAVDHAGVFQVQVLDSLSEEVREHLVLLRFSIEVEFPREMSDDGTGLGDLETVLLEARHLAEREAGLDPEPFLVLLEGDVLKGDLVVQKHHADRLSETSIKRRSYITFKHRVHSSRANGGLKQLII
ncbi:hypothetical protein PFISCL1PPCAC_7699, partial [Pristionchus fissidentatus]